MKTVVLMCSILACLLVVYTDAHAQCDSTYQQIMFRPGYRVYLLDTNGLPSTDTLDRSGFVPGYNLEYQSDSSTLSVQVSEFRVNSSWILLRDWCHGKVWNWDDSGDSAFAEVSNSLLSSKTTTQVFPMRPGDTVSVFRMALLRDPAADTLTSTLAKFPSQGTMSIEIVNASTESRIALLDTLSISSSGHSPCWFLPNAAVYRCVYINPSTTDTIWSYIRVHVGSADTTQLWMRNDHMTAAFSRDYISGSTDYAAQVQNNSICAPGGSSCDLSVGTSSLTVIASITANAGAYSHVRLVGLDGLIKSTVVTNGQSGPFNLTAPTPGMYLAILYSGTVPVCTKHIIVQ